MRFSAGPVGMISNPGSGHNRNQFGHIRARVEQHPGIQHIVTHSPDDIAPALQKLARMNTQVLAINGGDGTASAILGKLLESSVFTDLPLIALLPGGTANMNAGDIGVRGSLKKAVSRFCQWSEGQRTTEGQAGIPKLDARRYAPGHSATLWYVSWWRRGHSRHRIRA